MPSSGDVKLAERLQSGALLQTGEDRIQAALISAMRLWLSATRAMILGESLPKAVKALLADGQVPSLDESRAATEVWRRALARDVEPAIRETFGEGFGAQMRGANISPVAWQDAHIAEVHDRLVIWPEGAFEELRPELQEAINSHESIDQIRDRIGSVLKIDAPAKAVRADIRDIDRQLDDPLTPKSAKAGLRARKKELWALHDEKNREWQWKARRIARTETQGAIEGGALAAAKARAKYMGGQMFKQWLASHDERVRHTHAIADGQIVKVDEKFRVGSSNLDHPADPRGAAKEIINCRCTLKIIDKGEVDKELTGDWGDLGVTPMSARLGPDLPELVDSAVSLLRREVGGETVEWPQLVDAMAKRKAAKEAAETVAPVAPAVVPPPAPAVPEPGLPDTRSEIDRLIDEETALRQALSQLPDRSTLDAMDTHARLLASEVQQEKYYRSRGSTGMQRDKAVDKVATKLTEWLTKQSVASTPRQRRNADYQVSTLRRDLQDLLFLRTKIDLVPTMDHPLPGLKRLDEATRQTAKYDDHVKSTNPNFNDGQEWQINCQRCVQTTELRARGYDVTARPNRPGIDAGLGDQDILNFWVDAAGKAPQFTVSNSASKLKYTVESWGPNARGWITFDWPTVPGGKKVGSRHIALVRTDSAGKMIVEDSQTATSTVGHLTGDVTSQYIANSTGKNFKTVRVDELIPTQRVIDIIVDDHRPETGFGRRRAYGHAQPS